MALGDKNGQAGLVPLVIILTNLYVYGTQGQERTSWANTPRNSREQHLHESGQAPSVLALRVLEFLDMYNFDMN